MRVLLAVLLLVPTLGLASASHCDSNLTFYNVLAGTRETGLQPMQPHCFVNRFVHTEEMRQVSSSEIIIRLFEGVGTPTVDAVLEGLGHDGTVVPLFVDEDGPDSPFATYDSAIVRVSGEGTLTITALLPGGARDAITVRTIPGGV